MAFVFSTPRQITENQTSLSQVIKRPRHILIANGIIRKKPTSVSGEAQSSERYEKITPKARARLDPGSVPLFKTTERPARIAVTRERGKNDALMEATRRLFLGVEVIELPSVSSFALPGAHALVNFLKGSALDGAVSTDGETSKTAPFDWIIITSPEAASYVINAWRDANCPQLPKIAAVGRATSTMLHAVGIDVAFVPSKATGKTLCAELPKRDGGTGRILYPTSLKASEEIKKGLLEKGYHVTRVDAYTTETVKFDDMMKFLGSKTDIVTFGSPSAVRGWVENIGVNEDVIVACIGETSAAAARKAGFSRVHFPQQPGLDGWMVAVSEAMTVFETHKRSGRVGGGSITPILEEDENGNTYVV